MSTFQTIRRVTVYAAQEHEAMLTDRFTRFGSKGYTITPTKGVGNHASFDDPFATSTHVRIEALVTEPVADAIMNFTAALSAKRLPITACVENVQVCNPENF